MKLGWWLFLFPTCLFSHPKLAEVVSGEAHLNQMGNRLEVKVSDRVVIHWDRFSILSGEATHFIQPGADSAVLNRVMGGVTKVDGQLQANGRVYLLNPQGVIIGKEGVIQAAGFIASTLDLENELFFKGSELLFKGKSVSPIVNLGRIEALGEDVFLLAKAVLNEGTLVAKKGVVGVAAAEEVLLKPEGEQRLFIAPKNRLEKEERGIENKGLISAAQAELRADGNAYRFAINQEGIIEATSIVEKEGRIFLVADGGACIHSGQIKAPSGVVHVFADQVGLEGRAFIDVSGEHGGGEVLLGGDFQGKNPEVLNSKMTVVQSDASIQANATLKGSGGKIVCWSDGLTHMEGTLSADASVLSGDGGMIEISGKEALSFCGKISTRAPMGKKGQLLLDPSDIQISPVAMNTNLNFNSSTGVYTAIAATAEAGTLVGMETIKSVLDSGSTDVTITTDSGFSGTGVVLMVPSLSWSTDSSLTIRCNHFQLDGGAGTISCTGNGSFSAIAQSDIVITRGSFALSGGNITFRAGRDFTFSPQAEDLSMQTIHGNLVIDTGRHIKIGDSGFSAEMGTENGAVQMTSGGNLSVLGSTSANKNVIVSIGGLPNFFHVNGSLLVQGSNTATDAIAVIGGQGDRMANMEFKVLGNVSVIGGNQTESYAQIGLTKTNFAGLEAVKGDVTFSFIGGELLVMGGTEILAFGQIGHANSRPQPGFTAVGNIRVDNVFGPIQIVGLESEAVIGFGNAYSIGGDTYEGTVTVNGRAGTTMVGGRGGAGIGFFGTDGPNEIDVAGTVFFSDCDLTMSGDPLGNFGNAFIGAYASNIHPLNGILSLVKVDVRDQLVLNGGVASAIFDGTAAIGAYSQTGNVSGNVDIQAKNVFMNAPSSGFARILTSAEGTINDKQLTITAKNQFIGDGSVETSKVQILGGNRISLFADNDITILQPALISNASEDVRIVVDNDSPSSPKIGQGRFVMGEGAILESAGLLRIYTAQRQQNQIASPLNQASFIPGLFLVDSSTEQWASYFPKDFGGDPFTIFYKTGLNDSAFNTYGRAIAEMFFDLKTYDELLFQCKSFLFGFDRLCYDQLSRPRGMISSFDLFHDELVEVLLKQKYRSTHTKFVEAF